MTNDTPHSTVVLSVDDNPMIGETTGRWLRGKSGLRYAGHMLSGVGVVQAIMKNLVDLVLLDLEIPGTNTCGLVGDIRRARPECNVLMLSGHCRSADILECLSAGASGYVLKSREPSYIIAAINKVANGEPFICEEAAKAAGLA